MLLSHISFSLGLIALVAGVCLYLWSVRAEAGCGITLAKVIGVIVIILAILELLCTIYTSVRMRHFERDMGLGYGHCPMSNMQSNSMQGEQPAPASNVPANPTSTPNSPVAPPQ